MLWCCQQKDPADKNVIEVQKSHVWGGCCDKKLESEPELKSYSSGGTVQEPTTRRLSGQKVLVDIMQSSQDEDSIEGRGSAISSARTEWRQQQLVECEKTYGPDHPRTIRALANLAKTMSASNRPDEAIELTKRLVLSTERRLGREHVDTIHALDGLLKLMQEQKLYEEMDPLQRRQIRLCEAVHGEYHPVTMRAVNNAAVTLKQLGKDHELHTLHHSLHDTRSKHAFLMSHDPGGGSTDEPDPY